MGRASRVPLPDTERTRPKPRLSPRQCSLSSRDQSTELESSRCPPSREIIDSAGPNIEQHVFLVRNVRCSALIWFDLASFLETCTFRHAARPEVVRRDVGQDALNCRTCGGEIANQTD